MEFIGSGLVTRQGQITLPKSAREGLDLEVGMTVEFFYSDGLVLIKKKKAPIETFTELAAKTNERFAKQKITKEDIKKEISEYRKQKK